MFSGSIAEVGTAPGAGGRLVVEAPNTVSAGTGVSAHEPAATVRRLARLDARPEDFLRPGHVFPLVARAAGLADRPGPAERRPRVCHRAGPPQLGPHLDGRG